MNNFIKANYQYIFIVAFAIICYHFLWYNPFSMKWDLAEQYLPWRYFTGKSLQNGQLPFWNPYQLGGSPAFADPQSSALYYPAWFIGGLFGYSMKVIQLEILSLIILGGIGFFEFSKKIGNSTNSSFIVSLCYLSCGFFVGNAQHLTWIAAAAWLPWLFYQYLYIRKEITNKHLLSFLIILALFSSSAYPAFIIVAAYVIIIDQCILFVKSTNKLSFLKSKLILLLCCTLAIAPFIYSVLSSSTYFSRGEGISLAKALQHPFSIQSFLSFITPFASFKNNDFFRTDISMANAYMGLFPIVLILIYLLSKKNKKSTLWLLLSIVFMCIAIGEQLPIRSLLYEYIPGFNLFRFPSLFRLFFIICILLFSASYYDSLKIYIEKYRMKIIGILLFVLALFVIIILVYIKHWKPFSIESLNNLSLQFEQSTFQQHVLYQLAFQSLFLLTISLLLYFRLARFFMLIVICADLFISVRLNAMATMVLNTPTKNVDQLISSAPKKFHMPALQQLSNVVDQSYPYRWPLNWNMNCYYGEIAIDGYNPFVLKTFNDLENSTIKDSVFVNAWYYFPQQIIYADTIGMINANEAWVKTNDNKVENLQSNVSIESMEFFGSGLRFTYSADSAAAMVLAQNPYPGWEAFIDNEETSIEKTNYAQQLIRLKEGRHTVTWQYHNRWLNTICLLHLALFLLGLAYLSYKKIKAITTIL